MEMPSWRKWGFFYKIFFSINNVHLKNHINNKCSLHNKMVLVIVSKCFYGLKTAAEFAVESQNFLNFQVLRLMRFKIREIIRNKPNFILLEKTINSKNNPLN